MARIYQVDISSDGMGGRVVIDGHDISRAVRAVTWRGSYDEVAIIELELMVFGVSTLSSKVTQILLPDATSQALTALGWQPPDCEVTDGDPTPGG